MIFALKNAVFHSSVHLSRPHFFLTLCYLLSPRDTTQIIIVTYIPLSHANSWKFLLYVPDTSSFDSMERSTDMTLLPSVCNVVSSCQSSALHILTRPS